MTTFTDLGLDEKILKAIDDVGYTTPTPIQEQAIPYVLQMRDVLGCAQTGTGKTASFTLPMIEILTSGRARARMPRSLILEPTRELATQVADNFKLYGKYHPELSMALLIGGENMEPQIKNLERGVDVLIATPGRLIDLFERGRIMLNDIKIFVIDEADRMLDMGFIPDIEKIAKLLPVMRQTLFFSATMPHEIRKLAERFLSNPKTVTVSPPASTGANIEHSLIDLPSDNDWQKREALRCLLRTHNVSNAFIFCNRKRDVALLHKSLNKHGFNAGALHGDLDQSTRTQTLDAFRKGEISLLVCSDVAARGIDIADVSHVFNFDVPFNAEDYVHRIGRTGRAGKTGTALTLVTPDEGKLVTAIEALIKKEIAHGTIPELPAVDERRNRRAPKNKRPSPRSKENTRRTPKNEEAYVSPKQQPHPSGTVSGKKETSVAEMEATAFGDNLPAFLRRPRTVAKRSA
ncbi:MAG: DEAD/DEAH box helicase [Bdellovibrionales bacterium]